MQINNDIKDVISEYKDFYDNSDLTSDEKIKAIYIEIKYDYDLKDDLDLFNYIESIYKPNI